MRLRPTQQSLSRGRPGGFGADLSRPRRWLTGVAGVTARPGGGSGVSSETPWALGPVSLVGILALFPAPGRVRTGGPC